MILLDTTIPVYALGEEHPLRHPCRTLVDAVGAGNLAATTTIVVVQELIHVRARRRNRHDAAVAARAFAGLPTPLLDPDEHDLRLGIDLFDTVDALGLGRSCLRRHQRAHPSRPCRPELPRSPGHRRGRLSAVRLAGSGSSRVLARGADRGGRW